MVRGVDSSHDRMGQVTPPIGMNVFAMSAIAPDVPMYSIFRGILPFWGAFIVLVIILVMFPRLVYSCQALCD